MIFELIVEAACGRVEELGGAVERCSKRRGVASTFGRFCAPFETGVKAVESGVDFGDAPAFFGDSAFGARYRDVSLTVDSLTVGGETGCVAFGSFFGA